jgi:hypothetical protein
MSLSTRRYLRTTGIVLGGLLGAAIIVIGVIYVNSYNETRHPTESRTCECDLLTQWASSLSITPQGDQLLHQDVTVDEGPTAFGIGIDGMSPDGFSRAVLIKALTEAGITQVEDTNTDDLWSASFLPGDRFGYNPWRMTITTAEDEIGIGIGVQVDGSPWGLETNEDLHDLYRDDPEAALAAQEERQRRAIETLQPLEHALQTMVDNG